MPVDGRMAVSPSAINPSPVRRHAARSFGTSVRGERDQLAVGEGLRRSPYCSCVRLEIRVVASARFWFFDVSSGFEELTKWGR